MLTIKPSHSINNPTAFKYRKYNDAIVININIQNTRLVNWSIQGWSEEKQFKHFNSNIWYNNLLSNTSFDQNGYFVQISF